MSTNEDQRGTGGASAPTRPTQNPPPQPGTIPDWHGGSVATPWATTTGGSAPSQSAAPLPPTASATGPRVAPTAAASGSAATGGRSSSVPAPALVGGRIREFIWLSAAVVDAFLALDFLFRALGSAGGGFVSVVAEVGGALGSPFSGIVRAAPPPTVGHTADWPLLVAIVVYTAAAWIAARMCLVLLGQARPAAPY